MLDVVLETNVAKEHHMIWSDFCFSNVRGDVWCILMEFLRRFFNKIFKVSIFLNGKLRNNVFTVNKYDMRKGDVWGGGRVGWLRGWVESFFVKEELRKTGRSIYHLSELFKNQFEKQPESDVNVDNIVYYYSSWKITKENHQKVDAMWCHDYVI